MDVFRSVSGYLCPFLLGNAGTDFKSNLPDRFRRWDRCGGLCRFNSERLHGSDSLYPSGARDLSNSLEPQAATCVFAKSLRYCRFLLGREFGDDPGSVIQSKRELPAVQVGGAHLASQFNLLVIALLLQSGAFSSHCWTSPS